MPHRPLVLPKAVAAVLVLALPAMSVGQTPSGAYRAHVGTINNSRFGNVVTSIGDVDGDGVADYAIAAPHVAAFRGAVYLFSGADGSFIRQFNGQAMFGLFGSSVAGVGDIDGDGCPDIVIGAPTEYDGITIHGAVYIISVATGQVLHRIGDYHAADATGWSVAGVGDVDGDGVPDIAVGAPTTDWLAPGAGAVRIHSGATGELITGRFGHGPYANLGTSIARVGYARMIAAGAPAGGAPCGVNSAPASVVILDAGTGMLVRALFSPGELGFGASLAPIGDLNGDGMPEIAVGSPFYGVGKGRVYVYNFMTGAKLLEVTGEVGDRLGSAVAGAGDQSGDGIPDFLVGAPAHNSWIGQVQLRSGSDASLLRVMRGTPQAKTFGYAISDLGDINGDGVDDCIIGQDHGVGGAYIFTGFVNQFGFADFLPLPLTGSKTGFMTVADLDGNGSADIVTLNPSTNRLTVSYSNGDGSFMPPRHFPTLSKPTALAIADVNFDEKPDIIVTMAGSNRIAFYRNVGTGLAYDSAITFGKSPSSIVAADFNRDGLSDLAVAYRGSNTIAVFHGLPGSYQNLASRFVLIEVYKVGNNPIQIGAGRLNGDDFADIVVLNRDSKNASVLINRGNGRFLPQQKTALGGTPVAMTLADLTGNGRSDLALLLAGSNKVAVRKFSGKKFGPAKIFNVGPNPKWLTVADVNDDVRLDIITTNAGNKTVSVLLHNGNNGFLPRQDHPTGFASTFVAAADIDGDGDLDIVAAKPSGSDVAVLENTLININPYP